MRLQGLRSTSGRRVFIGVAVAAVLMAALMAAPAVAFGSDAPHVVAETETDACAMCHRAHTASSDVENESPLSLLTTGSALIYGTWDGVGDTELCFSCHGVAALGANSDVESAFSADNVHSLAPSSSAYGPPEKQCASCHDTHGTSRDASGSTYAALLRSDSTTNTALTYYQGAEYCESCHQNRPDNRWDGTSVWNMTAHAQVMTAPASGTQVICSNCHEPHGSNNTALIVESLAPPTAPATVSVPANDRWLCFSCHPGPKATYPGGLTYQVSSHGATETTVPVAAEWASAEESRTVGECQTCHTAMGRSDGDGGTIPKNADAAGKDLCFRCHGLSSTISTDIAQFEFPAAASTAPEVLVTYDPSGMSAQYTRIHLYTQETTGSAPLDLVGPRQYPPAGRATDVASGDINGDGIIEAVVADPSASRLEVWTDNSLDGLIATTYAIDVVAEYVDVADVFVDGTGLPEIAVVTRSATSPFASSLYIYRLSGTSLTRLVGPVSVGDDGSGLASGNVTGTAGADLVVTAAGSDALRVFTESAVTPGTLAAGGPYTTRSTPRGPSIGDAWDGTSTANEILVANSGEVTDTVSVFNGAGTVLGSYDATMPGSDAIAWQTGVGDPFNAVTGDETVVTMRSETSSSGVNVFTQLTGGGLSRHTVRDVGLRDGSSSLAMGDINADGHVEILVGNAGVWDRTTTGRSAAVQILRPLATGNGLQAGTTALWGGGRGVSGNPPGIIVADLGPVGESRHQIGTVDGAHVSTETGAPTQLVRHTECTDCHNVHEATSTVTAAPAVVGELKGAWGVEIDNAPAGSITLTERRGVLYEYELCLKCHSQWTDLSPSRDIAAEVDTRNASVHAIEASSTSSQATAGSFTTATPSWSNDSILYCTDCHTNSDPTEPKGPHTSEEAPILEAPYWGVRASEQGNLCYQCHKYEVYYLGDQDSSSSSWSLFRNDDGDDMDRLHWWHVRRLDRGCDMCHISHGSTTLPHLIRGDIGYTHVAAGGGSCNNVCHDSGPSTSTLQPYSGP